VSQLILDITDIKIPHPREKAQLPIVDGLKVFHAPR